MGQVAATLHVRWHALVASDYAVTMINAMYPGNLRKVKEERGNPDRLDEWHLMPRQPIGNAQGTEETP